LVVSPRDKAGRVSKWRASSLTWEKDDDPLTWDVFSDKHLAQGAKRTNNRQFSAPFSCNARTPAAAAAAAAAASEAMTTRARRRRGAFSSASSSLLKRAAAAATSALFFSARVQTTLSKWVS